MIKHLRILKQLGWFTIHGLIRCGFESFFFCFLRGDAFFHASYKLVQSRFISMFYEYSTATLTPPKDVCGSFIFYLGRCTYTEVSYRPRKGKPWLQLKNSILSFSRGFSVMLCCRVTQFSLLGPSFLLQNQGFRGAMKINQVRLAVFSSTLHDGCSQKTHASWILLSPLGLRFKQTLPLAMQLCLIMVLKSHCLSFNIHLIIPGV